VTQSKRFDPEGNFIRQYCPELAKLDKKNIHLPLHEVANYPTPIIDLSMSRQRAILHYKKYI
jgi:deoxyribodipyrimidine photo-lyase